ncbi:hypothetical protein EMIHUDRAFT_256701 [Emiliania huxleyi CCMP1516]|uniref:Uncharacterized protein n=2 Tax=Emiliania huxleyi TaxID=2903 RepID=A0A0D3IRR4_EMIH1|nr:hypothetical protein EMIHUDRAFT_256701 [Emiliania huxleyi CCMP1516]EOD13949.1 hypothetical protein EMIHUDRAFT_256701 [Emiliania huxleyi CCMP1516]|eukprot:XP_005766378.1 hypothetical protein EMIHUDRAFT_256701 [Emiliania huxleyi CCMP1516]
MPDWLEVVEAFTCDRRVDARDHNALDGLPFYAEKNRVGVSAFVVRRSFRALAAFGSASLSHLLHIERS